MAHVQNMYSKCEAPCHATTHNPALLSANTALNCCACQLLLSMQAKVARRGVTQVGPRLCFAAAGPALHTAGPYCMLCDSELQERLG
jgi:hypothetical protein